MHSLSPSHSPTCSRAYIQPVRSLCMYLTQRIPMHHTHPPTHMPSKTATATITKRQSETVKNKTSHNIHS
ncbi:hypothetical protein IQ07DRAFT_348725 [Pyrenochaeta sp. DS3sAY3a]|nr:hypothetical protein IQ07DRAFT_348725 [Pyrenochaeta sp. DS3sAY3a]